MTALPPVPAGDRPAVEAWVARHLGRLVLEGPDGVAGSPAFSGGQSAADAALERLDVTGYARRRSEVWPPERRGASRMSPYIRHGLVDLPRAWAAVETAPERDRRRFRDELLWQEYARHLYARVGGRMGSALRHEPPAADGGSGHGTEVDDGPRKGAQTDGRSRHGAETGGGSRYCAGTSGPSRDAGEQDGRTPGRPALSPADPWPSAMACMATTVGELESDGWLVNQTRMWLASQWTVRAGADWRAGEDRFFRHLLDGSRAANRLGWQWAVGTGTGRPYGFSRWQVEKRAPALCRSCPLARACPVQEFPDAPAGARVEPPAGLGADPDPERTGGPVHTQATGVAEAVWLTAESLGDADPALGSHPELPAVFVFDAERLERWRLSGKRLVFLAETLGDLAARRPVELHLGAPAEVLRGRPLAATYTPVPGWRRLAAELDVVERHPWRWLARPHGRSARSFSAWRKAVDRVGGVPESLF